MNYEDFLSEYQSCEKALGDAAKLVMKLQKAMAKETAMGDIKGARKDLESLRNASESLKGAIEAAGEALSSFDLQHYIESGDYASQLVDAVRAKDVDIAGESPVWEVFPFRVRLDAESQEVYVNKKKLPSFRPSWLADKLADDLEKVRKSSGSFNAVSYANELENAYETIMAKDVRHKLGKGDQVDFKDIYNAMVPSRFRSLYDMQAFTYDISKLYNANLAEKIVTKAGHSIEIGTSRQAKNNLRILDSLGREQWVGGISFR